MSPAENKIPDALLFITPGCPHCPVVLQGLTEMVKEGVIGSLEVVNVAVHPERAAAIGVRSAPWTRLGPFVLEGAQSPAALKEWAKRAGSPEGMTRFLEHLLAGGGLAQAENLIRQDPSQLAAVLPLLGRLEVPMQVRLGADALLESQAGSEALQALVPTLGRLSEHADHRVRGDACHHLGLSGSETARPYLEARLEDENPEVREIARESLEGLEGK